MQEMARVLFIFAKLNPGLTYVQGMNELLAPLYHLFRTDKVYVARIVANAVLEGFLEGFPSKCLSGWSCSG